MTCIRQFNPSSPIKTSFKSLSVVGCSSDGDTDLIGKEGPSGAEHCGCYLMKTQDASSRVHRADVEHRAAPPGESSRASGWVVREERMVREPVLWRDHICAGTVTSTWPGRALGMHGGAGGGWAAVPAEDACSSFMVTGFTIFLFLCHLGFGAVTFTCEERSYPDMLFTWVCG